MSRADYLLLCRRCRAHIDFDTDGNGRLIELETPCVCPPGMAQPTDADATPEPPGRITYGIRQSRVTDDELSRIVELIDGGLTREETARIVGYSASHVGYLYRTVKRDA